MTSIALASNEEALVVLGHVLEERLQELVHVLGDTVLIVVPSACGEASAGWLVHPHDVCALSPRVRVALSAGSIRAYLARAVLEEQARHRRASRPTCQPHHHRIVGRVRAALEHPEEILLVGLTELEVAAVLLHIVVAKTGRALQLQLRLDALAAVHERMRARDGFGLLLARIGHEP